MLHLSPPNEKQKLFLQCRKKYIAFGGARGGGKSWAVRTKALLGAYNYAGIRILILRRTYPELQAACWILATAPATGTWTDTRGRSMTWSF